MPNNNAQPDLSKPYCFHVYDSQRDANGYIPSIVIQGDPAHYPLLGRGRCATPWYFGTTLEEARAMCDRKNLEMGVSPEFAADIVASSLTASLRQQAARTKVIFGQRVQINGDDEVTWEECERVLGSTAYTKVRSWLRRHHKDVLHQDRFDYRLLKQAMMATDFAG
jgi:hypothetical protein